MCANEKKEVLSSAQAKWYENCLWQPKLMYAISNVQQSSVVIFLAVYYQQTAGFSKVQIGVLQTLPCICAMVSPPIWGAVADYIRNQRAVHYFCIITGGLLMFCIQYFYWSYHWTLAVLVLANFQSMPAGSLMDHAVLDMIHKVGGEYGKQRLFGAVGWGAGAYITGLAVAAAGISWAFNISIIFMFASLLVLRTIPPVKHGHHDETHSAIEEGGKSARQPSFADNMRRICEKKDVIMLLLVVFFMGLMYGVLSSFLALNLFNLSGGNAQIVGIAIMCETLSELPAFFFSHAIIQKLGTRASGSYLPVWFAYLKNDYEEVLSGDEIEKEESEMFSPHHHSKAFTSTGRRTTKSSKEKWYLCCLKRQLHCTTDCSL
ncbi:Major facilitator superfamily domain [Phytophthora cactorum]|nr:Major facilitator superfamily domain [Phytophthora cactorum]